MSRFCNDFTTRVNSYIGTTTVVPDYSPRVQVCAPSKKFLVVDVVAASKHGERIDQNFSAVFYVC